ncbi:MAG: LysM peptidoglycan-binding domain-containing M23 family metallopeptidase [Nitriliruptorales bacterium]
MGRPGVRGIAAVVALVYVASAHQTYTIQRGETLSGIAADVGATVRAIVTLNGIADPDRIVAGQTLELPGNDTGTAASAVHVVAPGETLSGIAARYGTSVAELARANGIADPNRIVAGERLRIPAGWRCPVDARVRFVDDFGVRTRKGVHEGVDVFAWRDTPVVASVPGEVEHVRGSRGGLQYWLHGDDGKVYVGTHLERFGKSGRVEAGTVVGYAGTSGNARATSPHLHFEVLVGPERRPANPYPLLAGACRR